MPLYKFQCYECGCEFDLPLSIKQAEKPVACVSCGEEAELLVPDDVNFSHQPGKVDLESSDTGVSSTDYNWDRLVGEDSKIKWRRVDERDKEKREILRSQPGATKGNLIRHHNGTYRVGAPSPEEKTLAKRKKIHEFLTRS